MPVDMGKARNITIGLALFVIVAGVVVLTLHWNTSGKKTIRAGKIEVNYGQPGQTPPTFTMQGSFTVYTPVLEFDAIPSQGTGGACLVADLNPDKPSGVPLGGCSTNADCQGSLNTQATGWFGYCDKQDKKCWVRPGRAKELCNRSIDVPPGQAPIIWKDGHKNPVPQMPPIVFHTLSPDTQWRVVACLNQLDPVTMKDVPPCGAQLEFFGPPHTVKYRPTQ